MLYLDISVYCAALLQSFSVPAHNVHMCYQSPNKNEYQLVYLNIDAGLSVNKIALKFLHDSSDDDPRESYEGIYTLYATVNARFVWWHY